jgi:hypothetical protein
MKRKTNAMSLLRPRPSIKLASNISSNPNNQSELINYKKGTIMDLPLYYDVSVDVSMDWNKIWKLHKLKETSKEKLKRKWETQDNKEHGDEALKRICLDLNTEPQDEESSDALDSMSEQQSINGYIHNNNSDDNKLNQSPSPTDNFCSKYILES